MVVCSGGRGSGGVQRHQRQQQHAAVEAMVERDIEMDDRWRTKTQMAHKGADGAQRCRWCTKAQMAHRDADGTQRRRWYTKTQKKMDGGKKNDAETEDRWHTKVTKMDGTKAQKWRDGTEALDRCRMDSNSNKECSEAQGYMAEGSVRQ